MVFGSSGVPLAPWQAAQTCTLASILASCACAVAPANANRTAAAILAEKRVNIGLPPRVFFEPIPEYPQKPRAAQGGPEVARAACCRQDAGGAARRWCWVSHEPDPRSSP